MIAVCSNIITIYYRNLCDTDIVATNRYSIKIEEGCKFMHGFIAAKYLFSENGEVRVTCNDQYNDRL